MENLNFKTSRGESRLNKHLVEQQKISDENIKEIKKLHCEKDALYDKIEATGDPEILKEIEEVEGKLQIAWKFRDTPDPMYFEHWKVPGCSCPVMDNVDCQGFMKYYSGGCKWHGKELKEYEGT